MGFLERPPLSPAGIDDRAKVEAVLILVSDLSADEIRASAPGLADLPANVVIEGVDTSPDTIFFNPDRTRFEASATLYLGIPYGRAARQISTETVAAVVKGAVDDDQARLDMIDVDTTDLFDAG